MGLSIYSGTSRLPLHNVGEMLAFVAIFLRNRLMKINEEEV
jgi:hypothetical protein